MKRAKQRKRHYPYKWAGTFSYVDLDVYRELAKPVAEGICPACGKPYTWDSGCHKLFDGEIGKFDGGVVFVESPKLGKGRKKNG